MKINVKDWSREEKLEQWGEGEWLNEPDEVVGEYKGIKYRIERKYHGALCGYVKAPCKALFHDDYDVHGGITYTEPNLPDRTENDGWWVGFDCCHGFVDWVPAFENNKKLLERLGAFGLLKERRQNYKTIDFVRMECVKLIDQMKPEKPWEEL